MGNAPVLLAPRLILIGGPAPCETKMMPGKGNADARGPEAMNEQASGDDGPGSAQEPEPEGLRQRIVGIWKNPAYRFVLLFIPYLVVVSIGYPMVVEHMSAVVQAFILWTAELDYQLLSLFSNDVRIDGKTVRFGDFVVRIIDECTGIYEMLIFSAAVLAFPTNWRSKMIGLLGGCPLIYVFNVLRIAGLIVVGRYWHVAFDFMHLYFWQVTMIAMITSVWLLWILKVVNREDQSLDSTD